MGFFDKMFGKPQAQPTGSSEQTPAKILFAGNTIAANNIFDDDEKTKGGVFEALLLASIYTLMSVKAEKPHLYAQFETQYFSRIEQYARAEGIMGLIKGDYAGFVNNRFQFYGRISRSSDQATLNKTVYNFFENPLQLESGFCSNPMAMLIGLQKVTSLFEMVDENRKMVYHQMRL